MSAMLLLPVMDMPCLRLIQSGLLRVAALNAVSRACHAPLAAPQLSRPSWQRQGVRHQGKNGSQGFSCATAAAAAAGAALCACRYTRTSCCMDAGQPRHGQAAYHLYHNCIMLKVSFQNSFSLQTFDTAELGAANRSALLNEVRLLAALEHPHIVAFKNTFLTRDRQHVCVAMELLRGGTLGDMIK